MADGDIIHSRLRGIYQKPYKWLCEGKATIDECAHVLMQALKKDIVKKGDLPLKLAQKIGQILSQTISAPGENGSVDCAALSLELDRLIWQFDGQPYVKELIRRAVKSWINDLRYGREVDFDNISAEILKRYMKEVYESEFTEKIPLTSIHHDGIDQATLSKRIGEIQPIIDDPIGEWAKTAIKEQSIEKLRMPRRFPQEPVDLNEDLLAG
jgi:hypothetical protein